MSDPHHLARLREAKGETPHLRSLVLDVPAEVSSDYLVPGQFVEVRLSRSSEGSYFALANGPGSGHLELLIKRAGGLSDELWALPPGSELWVSTPMGEGFPVSEGRGKDLLLFATGSGFAPIRAALQVICRERESYGDVHLFFGVRTEEDFPYREELDRLPSQAVQVHRTVSRRPEPTPGHGRYVQERFLAMLPPVANAVAFLCGIEGMVHGVTKALHDAGMSQDRIYVNL